MGRTNSVGSLLKVPAHGGALLAVLGRLSRSVPPFSPLVHATSRALARYTDTRSRRFDARYGLDTHARVRLSSLAFEKPLDPATWTDFLSGPICPDFFREIMRHVQVPRETWTFVDVGAGKGRAVLLAYEAGFRRIVGLEFSAELIEIARRNVERYHACTGAKVGVDWAHADALTFDYPAVPSVLFLNNPFPTDVAIGAVERIEASLREHPRPLRVVYRRPPPGAMARLDSSPLLRLAVSTPYWRVYESAGASDSGALLPGAD